MAKESVIVAAKRTPIGSFQGQLSKFSSPDLASTLIDGIIKELGLKSDLIDEVILGNVLVAGLGQAPARQAAILAGCDKSIEALTINKMCGSGLKAVMLADQSIRCGDANIILSGGMESMSNSPYLLTKARGGLKLGHGKIVDSVIHDGLWDAYNNMHMGNCAELLASERKYSRLEQDTYATRSYEKSLKAQSEGLFESEIIPMIKKDKKNNIIEIVEDEEPKRVVFDKIKKLKPVFENNGTITAANASTLNDGASVLLVMSQARAKELCLSPLAKIMSHASYAHDPKWFTTAPSKVIEKVLKKSSMDKKDIGLWEINEAFSVVPMATIDDFNLDVEKVNIYGGAVALGHPIGASGARILTTLLNGMNKQNIDVGLASICIGGGEASAIIVEKNMTDFNLTEEQIMVQKTARDFAKSSLELGVIERDEKSIFPKEQIKQMGELGFMGMMVPEKWGGSGMDTFSFVLAIEEIASVELATSTIMSVNNSLVCQVLDDWGTDFQKNKYLKDLSRGLKLGAYSLSEPQSGSDASNMKTTAEKVGNSFIINGIKNWVTNGQTSDIIILFCLTRKDSGSNDISAFIVDKQFEGISVGKKEDKLGLRASDTCELYFENCKVPEENLLGNLGDGFKIAMKTLGGGRIGIASQAVGLSRSALEKAINYSKEREQFGKKISEFGSIKNKIADMAMNTEAARLLVWKAAYLKDNGKNFNKESSMAKLFSSKTAMTSASECVQIHGGYGYIQEYGVERLMRDAKITEIYEGTSEIQRLVISREVIK